MKLTDGAGLDVSGGEWRVATRHLQPTTLNPQPLHPFHPTAKFAPLLCFEGKLVGLQIEMERLQAFRAIFFCKRQLTENGRFFSAS
ncbi:MAG: hypothetical protein M5U34_14735 [Chloroflexi bacterium]|nr:hypothetical protein [Chloroflexota bacterium]